MPQTFLLTSSIWAWCWQRWSSSPAASPTIRRPRAPRSWIPSRTWCLRYTAGRGSGPGHKASGGVQLLLPSSLRSETEAWAQTTLPLSVPGPACIAWGPRATSWRVGGGRPAARIAAEGGALREMPVPLPPPASPCGAGRREDADQRGGGCGGRPGGGEGWGPRACGPPHHLFSRLQGEGAMPGQPGGARVNACPHAPGPAWSPMECSRTVSSVCAGLCHGSHWTAIA